MLIREIVVNQLIPALSTQVRLGRAFEFEPLINWFTGREPVDFGGTSTIRVTSEVEGALAERVFYQRFVVEGLTAISETQGLILQRLEEERGERSEDPDQADLATSNRVDVCDTRVVFGTCVEYTMTELDEWYQRYVERACPDNRRGDLFGTYRKESRCPEENRVARCEGIVEDPAERYEYDKHYYANTADGYTWEAANVQVTCEQVSGRFLLD